VISIVWSTLVVARPLVAVVLRRAATRSRRRDARWQDREGRARRLGIASAPQRRGPERVRSRSAPSVTKPAYPPVPAPQSALQWGPVWSPCSSQISEQRRAGNARGLLLLGSGPERRDVADACA
jgi:hypothetical protein